MEVVPPDSITFVTAVHSRLLVLFVYVTYCDCLPAKVVKYTSINVWGKWKMNRYLATRALLFSTFLNNILISVTTDREAKVIFYTCLVILSGVYPSMHLGRRVCIPACT